MTGNAVFNEYFNEFINDAGIQIKPAGRGSLTLRDIYVFPDLDVLSPGRLTGAGARGGRINSSVLLDPAAAGGGALICGPGDSGKTSLLKVLARGYLDAGFLPVYADGKVLRIPRPEGTYEFFLGKYRSQYTAESYGIIEKEPAEKRILLLDNADRIKTGSAELGSFLLGLKAIFGTAILTAANTPEFADLPEGMSVFGAPEGYAVFGIAEIGRELREELISKWTGSVQAEDEKAAAQRKDRLRGAVDTVLGRNLVPSYPVFVLTILQMADSEGPSGPSASSYGQYYEYLITKSLKDALGRESLPFFIRLLSELAYGMFSRRSRWISEESFETLTGEVSADFPNPPEGPGTVITALLESGTLAGRESGYEFRHGYAYHYFAALYLSRKLHEERVKEEVKRLSGRLDEEECAGIMLYLTHLSADPFLLEQIARNVEYAAASEEPYSREDEEPYLDELLRDLEKLIDKDRKLREIRAEYLPEAERRPRQPIGFRTNGADIRVRRRKEAAAFVSSRRSMFIDALLRISSGVLTGQPAEGRYSIPREFGENIYALWSSALRRRKREADRVRIAAEGREGGVLESAGTGEELSYTTALYGLYMWIYVNAVRHLSLLTEAGAPEYTNTIPDELMRICAGLFRKDQQPGVDTIERFLEENRDRIFARELIRQCASLRIYIFGDDSEYSRELGKLVDSGEGTGADID